MQKFSKKSSLLLTLCILSAISSSGYAAEKDSLHQYNLDEYVVTATRTALTQKEVPQSVEVITKDDIQNVGAISVRDVLKTATNLHIDDGGGGHEAPAQAFFGLHRNDTRTQCFRTSAHV